MVKTTTHKFNHNPKWLNNDLPESIKTKEHTAYITEINVPFGRHFNVVAFDGELILTVMISGGHSSHVLVIEQVCDSPHRTIYDGRSTPDGLVALINALPHKEGERSLRVVVWDAWQGLNEKHSIENS